MHKALKMIKNVLDNCMIRLNLMNELISINRTKLKYQEKRIKSLEFMIDKYIRNNDQFPSPEDTELMINDPDDGSWKGR